MASEVLYVDILVDPAILYRNMVSYFCHHYHIYPFDDIRLKDILRLNNDQLVPRKLLKVALHPGDNDNDDNEDDDVN